MTPNRNVASPAKQRVPPTLDEDIALLLDSCDVTSRSPLDLRPKLDHASPIYKLVTTEIARQKAKRRRRQPCEIIPAVIDALEPADDGWAKLDALCRPQGEVSIVGLGERMPETASQRRAREAAYRELDRATVEYRRKLAERDHTPAASDAEIDDVLGGLLGEPKVRAQRKSGNGLPEGTAEGAEKDPSVRGKIQNHSLQTETNQPTQTEIDKTQIHTLQSERSAGEGPQAPTEASEALPEGREAAEGASTAKPTRKPRRRIERDDVQLPARPVRRPRKRMAPYEYLREDALVILAHDELLRRGPVLGFTLNVHKDWAAKAIAGDHPANLLSKRIRREFRLASLEWQGWFVIEITPSNMLHLHGAGLGTPEEAERIRRAMRRAAGEWDDTRQWQCHTSIDPDFGWAGYAMKDLGRAIATKLVGPGRGMGRLPFKGKHFSVSRDIIGAAKARYNEDRAVSIAEAKQSKQSVRTDISPIVDESKQISESQPAPIEAPAEDEGLDHALCPSHTGSVRGSACRPARPESNHPAQWQRSLPHRPPPRIRARGDRPRRRALRHAGVTSGLGLRLVRPP